MDNNASKRLLDQAQNQDTTINEFMNTIQFIKNNHSDNMMQILNHKDEDGRSAVHWFAANGKDFHLEVLLDIDCDVNTCDDGKWTPLHSACSAGHTDVVTMLLPKLSSPNCINAVGATPLLYAASKGHEEIVSLLLDNNADPCQADYAKCTPLHRAAAKGHMDIAELLCSRSVDMNAQDKSGYTPLHHSCMDSNKEMATLLIEFGADARIRDNEGKVAFKYSPPEHVGYLVALVIEQSYKPH